MTNGIVFAMALGVDAIEVPAVGFTASWTKTDPDSVGDKIVKSVNRWNVCGGSFNSVQMESRIFIYIYSTFRVSKLGCAPTMIAQRHRCAGPIHHRDEAFYLLCFNKALCLSKAKVQTITSLRQKRSKRGGQTALDTRSGNRPHHGRSPSIHARSMLNKATLNHLQQCLGNSHNRSFRTRTAMTARHRFLSGFLSLKKVGSEVSPQNRLRFPSRGSARSSPDRPSYPTSFAVKAGKCSGNKPTTSPSPTP